MRRRGTTLVELMIVVAIIAILASIAVTCWLWLARWVRELERFTIVSYLETELEAHGAGLGPDTELSFVWPDDDPGRTPRGDTYSFDLGDESISLRGPVYCSYAVRVNQAWWSVTAWCDTDGDKKYATLVRSDKFRRERTGATGGGDVTASCDVGLVPSAPKIATDFAREHIGWPIDLCNAYENARLGSS